MNPAKRLRAHARGAALRLRRGASHVSRLYRGRFRGFKNVFGLPLEGLRGPLTRIPLGPEVVHTFDFLPDRLTLTGTAMAATPHTAFARDFLSDPAFDYRRSEYYLRTAKGTLAVPSAGVPHAEWRCRNFMYVIRAVATEGYCPDGAAITVVECADGRLMVVNGKHRLAALLALGQPHVDVVVLPANEFIATVQGQVNGLWPESAYVAQFAALRSLGRPLEREADRIQRLVQRIRDAKLEERNDVYHPIPFHDFRELRPMTDTATPYLRLATILRHSNDWVGKDVLDLGCNMGFYSFSLARRGARTTGIDVRPEYIEFAKEIADIYRLPASFRAARVTPELIREKAGEYDVTLSFSMLQWVIEQEGEEFGLRVLEAISEKSKALFFDVAVNSGRAQLQCKRGEEIAYVYDLLRRGTRYRSIEYVGEVEPWGEPRYIFHCSRGGDA